MTNLDILTDAEGCLPELEGAEEIILEKVGILPRGMTSGKSAVVFSLIGKDGKRYFAQTSLSLFMTASSIFNVQHMKEEANVS